MCLDVARRVSRGRSRGGARSLPHPDRVCRLKQDLKAESEKRQESEDNLARCNYDLKQARESVDGARTKVAADRDALQAVLGLTEWPKEVAEVAKFSVQLGSGRLVLTDEAVRSLEKSDFAKSSEASTVIWRCLRAMADDLHDLLLQKLPPQQIAPTKNSRSGQSSTSPGRRVKRRSATRSLWHSERSCTTARNATSRLM